MGISRAAIGRAAAERVTIDRAAVAIGVLALLTGVLVPVLATNGWGVGLVASDGRAIIASVDPAGPAAAFGFEPGMVALDVNGRQLVQLPQLVQPTERPIAEPSGDPSAGADPATTGPSEQPTPAEPSASIDPPSPTPYLDPPAPVYTSVTQDALRSIVGGQLAELQAMRPADLAAYDPTTSPGPVQIFTDGRDSLQESMLAVLVGIAVLFAMTWWLTTGRAGRSLRDLGMPLAVATAGPFLLRPLGTLWAPVAVVASALLTVLVLLPLAAALVARIDDPQDRHLAMAAAGVCAAAAMVIGVAPLLVRPWGTGPFGFLFFVAGIAAFPGLVAAGPFSPHPGRAPAGIGPDITAGGRLLQSTELAVAGLTPAVSLASGTPPYWLLLALWVGAIALAGRFTVRPLARLASRAQLQRDLVVAATEAERARVAADIHDDALQELTLLVRRLDAAGDKEGADIARTVSDRLRAICGDLRLPILDDLGVGPALDWLVLRIERLAGGEVRLERADGSRPPADVELAFFRVAQEALANAVKHGRPPIVVRYRSSDGAASLSIDDAGAGIPADAGERAEREGHFGLLNMQQRAEGIGAILDVRRWPAGGTHVQLEWRAR